MLIGWNEGQDIQGGHMTPLNILLDDSREILPSQPSPRLEIVLIAMVTGVTVGFFEPAPFCVTVTYGMYDT